MSFHRFFQWLNYNLWYFGHPPWDTNISPPELMDFIDSHPPGKALDLGCGTGKNSLTLAEAGWQTVGVDMALLAIERARKRFQSAGLVGQFLSGDILENRFPKAEFDFILDIGCFHNLPEGSRRCYRTNNDLWLKAGGTFLLYGHRSSLKDKSELRITEEDIALFQQHFDLEERMDCTDRQGRQTVWLRFVKPAR